MGRIIDTESSAPAYHVSGLDFTAAGRRILEEISFAVTVGEVLLIAGHSGSGKSTLLKLLVRLLEPSGGHVRFFGQEIRSISPPQLRSRSVYVPQTPALGSVSVEENILLGPAFLRRDVDPAMVSRLLSAVRLPDEYAGRNTRSLSGGEQYRLSVAMAMALDPEVFLFDEPTGSLDPDLSDHMGTLIEQLVRRGASVVVVTHDMALVSGLVGRYLFLEAGRVRSAGQLHELIGSETARDIWNRLATREARADDV